MPSLKYPIGVQSFSEVIENGYVYVDKTGYLHKLLDAGAKYVFLNRPRRFGKSLFLTMIEEFFKGRRELFNGLEIDKHSYDWQAHPVLHLDFLGSNFNECDSLDYHLKGILEAWESTYGDEKSDRSVSERFAYVIAKAHELTGKKTVILIDEYDKPLLETIDNPTLQDKFRNILRGFYGNLKRQDAHIEFAMLTGVTKFGHLSIFSDLKDISPQKEFCGICGITTDELHGYFNAGVKEFAMQEDIGEEDVYELLRKNYDGYHFSPKGHEDIYNPFSVLNALSDRCIDDYWFKTGTPTFLIKLIKQRNISLQSLNKFTVSKSEIDSVSLDMESDLLPVLYQSGYLTILSYDKSLSP